jgi:hypothetical protein
MAVKNFSRFILFFLLVLSLSSLVTIERNFVLADECSPGDTRACPSSPCGVQPCVCHVLPCVWGNCVPDHETQACGDCGEQDCVCSGKSCDWDTCKPTDTSRDCGICGTQTCWCDPDACNWEDCQETPEPDTSKTDSWTEYRCQGDGCGNEYFEERDCQEDCTRTCNCVGGGKWDCTKWDCDTSCGSATTVEVCDLPWQLCFGGKDWSRAARSCDCAGSCLEVKNPRYYDIPDYPTDPFNPEDSKDPSNIFLPVKLDWDDVIGWKDDWKENATTASCSEDCVQSYLIEIKDTAEGYFSKVLTKSEYNPSQDKGFCFLKSNITQEWSVKACCNANGTNCSSGTNWSFNSNGAPELTSPFDSDWMGQEIVENIFTPVTLNWCDVENALSYRIRVYYIDKTTGNEICHPWLASDSTCGSKLIQEEKRPPPYPLIKKLYSDFKDEEGFFSIDTEYRWELAACFRADGSDCSDFGQKWGFKTASTSLPSLELLAPPDDPGGTQAVGLPVILKWKAQPGMNSFIYDVYKDNPGEISGWVNPDQLNLNFPTLQLDTLYTWKIKPCSDFEAKECGDWSEEWHFRTTGAPPSLIHPDADASDVVIPVTLDWGKVSGAGSYQYEISSDLIFTNIVAQGVTENSYISVDYPNLKMLTDYWWRVKTCADKEGKFCGDWSETRRFKTFKIGKPTNPYPPDEGNLFTYEKYMSWNKVPGAKKYLYTIDYTLNNPPPEEKSEQCGGLVGTTIIPSTITPSNSIFVSLGCLGEYNWRAQACLDNNCNEVGDWSSVWRFTLVQPPPPTQLGLVPCGRISDNPNTPWNERDPCQLKHIFILLRNIIDLLLWRIGLIILILLVIATGLLYYFSLGRLITMEQIKSLWRAAGIGYAILLLAWTMINLLLALLGYHFGIFGYWWEITF